MLTETEKKIENKVIEIARTNQSILAPLADKENDKSAQRFIDHAWQNEADLEYTAHTLEADLKRGIRELNEALEFLHTGQTSLLNLSGILQTTNDSIDRSVLQINEKLKTRSFYTQLLK